MTLVDVILIALAVVAGGLYLGALREKVALQQSLDQRAANEASLVGRLRQVEARAAALSDAPQHTLLVLDQQATIIYANARAIRLLGQAVIGQTVIEATRSYEIDELAQAALESHRPDDRPVSWNSRSFYVRAVPIEDGGAVLVMEDQTELQRLERVRRDFVANVSHELRTPLASIRLLIETLLGGVKDNPAVSTRMLNQVIAEVDALTQLAQELLDLSMIESGQMPMQKSPANLRAVVAEQLARFEPQAQPKNIAMKNLVPADLSAEIDQKMIGQALGNLIHNALKFTPNAGQITIGGTAGTGRLTISIADTGPGIPLEELPRIFERFYKVDRARGKAGTGLGLAIARHVVEAHGGRIWAESARGQGATFYFTLPVNPTKTTQHTATAGVKPAPG